MSAKARMAATICRFGLVRNRTVAPAELDRSLTADGSGASPVAAVRAHRFAPRLPASRRVLIAGAAVFAALALPAAASAAAPVVTIENASNPTVTTADVEGTVDPEGQPTSWHFEYITDVGYADNIQSSYPGFLGAATGPSGSASVAEAVSGQLTALQANTTYHLRLLAENTDGQSEAVAASTFTTGQAAPLVTTYDPEPVGAETAALDGLVDPRNSPTTYWFEWGTEDCEFSTCQSTAHASAGFDEIQQINLPNNENAEGEWNLSFEGQTTPDFPANPTGAAVQEALEGLSTIGAGNVSVSGASGSWEYLITFRGALANTNVEQVTAANGANPLPGNIGWKTNLEGGYRTSPKHVTQSLEGLEPETTYHFRLVAENSTGTTETPDREFTTTGAEPACTNPGRPGSNFLPDCRAYELVSPPSGKNGADVQAESHYSFASASGNGLAYLTSAGFGDVKGTFASAQYVARRTGIPGTNGWSSHNVSPFVTAPEVIAISNGNLPGFEAFNPELTAAVYNSWSTLADHPDPRVSEVTNFYRLDDLDGPDPSAQLLTESKVKIPVDSYTKRTLKNAYVGASQDLSHVFFQSPWNLTTNGAITNSYGGEFFEYTDAGGVRSIGRIPTGSDTQCDDAGGPSCVAIEAAPALSQEIHVRSGGYSEHTISTDGSRVLFSALENLYMRENGNVTYQINASERQPAATPRPASFQAMTPDGSRVFFTTQEPLVNGDEDPFSTDLYMYEVDKPVGHRLTLLSGSSDEGEAKLVVGTSTDGHYVYFVAGGQLVPGEPLNQRNGLYLWHDGTLSFIGNFGDTAGDATAAADSIGGANWSTPLSNLSSRVTPDGRTLLFMAEESGAFAGRGGYPGHNNGGTLCNTSPIGEPSPIGAHQPCRELYVYRADTGRIICVSCNPEGGVATGDALTDARFPNTITGKVQHVSHALSDDGRYVFFTSGEALVPEDTNGNTDAYEYDVQTESIHLISSGTDSQGAVFLDASPDGRNAFFVTTQQLVGWDTDNNADVYDARIDGGFPEPVPVPTGCQGESCLPSSPPAPSAPAIASPAPKPGNPKTPRRCPKRFKSVTKHGRSRCVKKAHAKHRKRKPHAKHRKANTNRRTGR